MFQSTLPRGERPFPHRTAPVKWVFQSTLPRGERPLRRGARVIVKEVSIHAPAWGATKQLFQPKTEVIVSIHAPAWGATQRRAAALRLKKVSIHAPAWGATFAPWCTGHRQRGFNPRSRVGSDPNPQQSVACDHAFQSTLPRGERRFSWDCQCAI